MYITELEVKGHTSQFHNSLLIFRFMEQKLEIGVTFGSLITFDRNYLL